MRKTTLFSCIALLGLAACAKHDQPANDPLRSSATTAPTQVDNTAKNARDVNGGTMTPGDQAENESDRGITAAVRRVVVDDDSLSIDAHNVKIITSGGVVTLRGPVKTEREKSTIDQKAKQVAGVARVDNQLEITGKLSFCHPHRRFPIYYKENDP